MTDPDLGVTFWWDMDTLVTLLSPHKVLAQQQHLPLAQLSPRGTDHGSAERWLLNNEIF